MGLKKSKAQVVLSDDRYPNATCLEDLSNEVIYELFDYLSYDDIYFSFGTLNDRLTNLIENYSHYVNLQKYAQDPHRPLPRHIHTLKINARYQLSLIDFSNISTLHGFILSNLPTLQILHILHTISLKELEYVYLGACVDLNERGREQMREIQQKILSLGELKLTKCVFRMRFLAEIEQLPMKLWSLEYLRIDGCENILIVHQLLHRMPNLRSLHVSIFQLIGTNYKDNQFIQQSDKHPSLTTLILRIYNSMSFEDLVPFIDRNGSHIKKLVISLNPIRDESSNHRTPKDGLTNLYPRITTMINQFLPQLKQFHLRQHILYPFLSRHRPSPPYEEQISDLQEHQSYRVFIAAHLTPTWRNRT